MRARRPDPRRAPSRARCRAAGPAPGSTRSAPARPTPRRAAIDRRGPAGRGSGRARRPPRMRRTRRARRWRHCAPAVEPIQRGLELERQVLGQGTPGGKLAPAPTGQRAARRLRSGQPARDQGGHRSDALLVLRRVETEPSGGSRRLQESVPSFPRPQQLGRDTRSPSKLSDPHRSPGRVSHLRSVHGSPLSVQTLDKPCAD